MLTLGYAYTQPATSRLSRGMTTQVISAPGIGVVIAKRSEGATSTSTGAGTVNFKGGRVGWRGAVALNCSPDAPSYRGYRFPVEVITHAVWLYFRFHLSLRLLLKGQHRGRNGSSVSGIVDYGVRH